METKIYTLYQTNKPNILGGYMTYSTLSEAMDALRPDSGINTITALTMVDSEWWHGKPTGVLCECVLRSVIYKV